MDAGASVIGVNARNLKTLEVHRDTFSRLVPLIPPGAVTVAESGVSGAADAAMYAAEGADAVLVGEALVSGPDPAAVVREIVGAGARPSDSTDPAGSAARSAGTGTSS